MSIISLETFNTKVLWLFGIKLWSYLTEWCVWRGFQIMKTLIGSDEVSSRDQVDLLVQQSHPVKYYHFSCLQFNPALTIRRILSKFFSSSLSQFASYVQVSMIVCVYFILQNWYCAISGAFDSCSLFVKNISEILPTSLRLWDSDHLPKRTS